MSDKVLTGAGERLRRAWRVLSPKPGGKWLFSRLVGRMAPYSGSVGALVTELRPGHARVVLRDRRRVRNHLGSIHAIALMNLGELATGLATVASLPASSRSILTGLSMEYLKKARGPITAACDVSIPETGERLEHTVEGALTDASGDVVARVTARWLVGPEGKR
jgi:acyl-coenzyme A thioesterase PaaI-like protein